MNSTSLLSAINAVIYVVAAKWYVYKEKRFAEVGIKLEEQENFGVQVLILMDILKKAKLLSPHA
ncbi:hypothetical protein HN873_066723, partial [Arachis hypogaea]